MSTKKHLPLDSNQVEKATQLFDACDHPDRCELINFLLVEEHLTADELASYLNTHVSNIHKHLDILCRYSLVLSKPSSKGELFFPNEDILLRLMRFVRNLN